MAEDDEFLGPLIVAESSPEGTPDDGPQILSSRHLSPYHVLAGSEFTPHKHVNQEVQLVLISPGHSAL